MIIKLQRKSIHGFILSEVILVIGLLAVLSTTVVIVLNPVEIYREARDAKRISDLNTLTRVNSLLSRANAKKFQLAAASSFCSEPSGEKRIFVSVPSDNGEPTPIAPFGWSYYRVSKDQLTQTNGTGWLPIDFQTVNLPLSVSHLPVDPGANTFVSGQYYTYICGYEMTAALESEKYREQEVDAVYRAGSQFNTTPPRNIHLPSCTPSSATVNREASVTITATGGAGPGTYSWSAPGGDPNSGSGDTFSVSYSTPGTKTITINSNGEENRNICQVTVIPTTSWTQTDWSGGASSVIAMGTVTTYSAVSNTDPTTSVGNLTLSLTSDWYNLAWKYRRKITFNNTTANLGVTSQTLTNFPVLVKLDSTRIDYANTQNAGQDIRFTDSNGTTLLSYEIEKWNETGTSYVWVKVPSIDINSNTDYIYAYYGNTTATDGQAATSVWDSNYKAVWHLKETGNGTSGEFKDSTSNVNNGRGGGGTGGKIPTVSPSGQIGNAQSFDGSNDDIVMNDFGLSMSIPITISFWAKSNDTSISSAFDSAPSVSSPLRIYDPEGGIQWHVYPRTSATVTSGQWTYISITYSGPTRTITWYKNGVSQTGASNADSPNFYWTTFVIGTVNRSLTPFSGMIDEMRVSTAARSAAWIAASYKSENDAYNTYASQEERYVSSGTLTSNILDSNTGGSYWGTFTYNYTGLGTVAVKARTSNAFDMTGATAFSSCAAVASGADISANSCVTDEHRYFQYQVTLTSSSADTPMFQDLFLTLSPFN